MSPTAFGAWRRDVSLSVNCMPADLSDRLILPDGKILVAGWSSGATSVMSDISTAPSTSERSRERMRTFFGTPPHAGGCGLKNGRGRRRVPTTARPPSPFEQSRTVRLCGPRPVRPAPDNRGIGRPAHARHVGRESQHAHAIRPRVPWHNSTLKARHGAIKTSPLHPPSARQYPPFCTCDDLAAPVALLRCAS